MPGPLGIASHCPKEQPAQAPVHAALQHTLPTQYPVRHWSAAVHVVPVAWLSAQIPAIEQLPLLHWSFAEQAVPSAFWATHCPLLQ